MFPERRFAEAPVQIEKALALTNPRGTEALDLCCGPGRCSLALAQAGFSVTGVDRTNFLLDKARARAHAANPQIEWVQMERVGFIDVEVFGNLSGDAYGLEATRLVAVGRKQIEVKA